MIINVIRPFIAISIGGNAERKKPLAAAAFCALLLPLLLLLATPLPGQSVSFSGRSGSIEMSVEPEEAELLLDNEVVGAGEVELLGLQPGSYKIEARLPGHYRETRYVTLSPGEEVQIEFVLEEIVGYLDLQATPVDATIIVGEDVVEEFPTKLAVGSYMVEARRFGYTSERERIEIGEGVVTRVEFTLEPAPFEITALSISKRRFNPANPGRVGTTRLSFRVSSYGTATFIVRSGGTVVHTEELPPFTGWEQSVLWEGRGPEGAALPEGSYQVEIAARGGALGSAERVVRTARTEIIIDRRIVSRYRSIFSGSSGLLYAPLAEPLGPGSTQVSTQAIAYTGSGEQWYAPVVIGTRFGLGVPTSLTLTAGPLISSDAGTARIAGSIAFDWRYFHLPELLSFATVVKGSVASPVEGSYGGRDERTNPTGLSLQHPATLYIGRFYLTAAPELVFGPDGVSYSADPSADGGLWAYFRGGLGYDGEILSLGISAALRSTILTEEIDYKPPIPLGAELHFRVPSSPLYLSLLLAADLYPEEESWRAKGGFGAGILF